MDEAAVHIPPTTCPNAASFVNTPSSICPLGLTLPSPPTHPPTHPLYFPGALNDYQKDLQFRKLNAQKDVIDVKAIRSGKTLVIKNNEIVVGDILLLDTGTAGVRRYAGSQTCTHSSYAAVAAAGDRSYNGLSRQW
jgi:hypothetical protein